MNDKYFLDSNVCIYLLEKNSSRQQVAQQLVAKDAPVISTQVIGENINVCLKKLRFNKAEAFKHAHLLISICTLVVIDQSTVAKAMEVSLRYGYSYYDSLIIASALQNDCRKLYSEDMQHQQEIEDRLEIINPFV